jgi:hypothetical protein
MHASSPRGVAVAFDAQIEHLEPADTSESVLALHSVTQNEHGWAFWARAGDDACIQRNGRQDGWQWPAERTGVESSALMR